MTLSRLALLLLLALAAPAAAQSAPISDGDLLVYEVSLVGSGEEGPVRAAGTLTVVARAEGGVLVLEPAGAVAAGLPLEEVLVWLSDLTNLTVGVEARYTLPSLEPLGDHQCPVIEPERGRGGKGKVSGDLYTYFILFEENLTSEVWIQYKCTYSEGILVALEAEANGTIYGEKGAVKIKAELVYTTIEGVEVSDPTSLAAPAIASAAAASSIALAARLRTRA